MTAMTASVPQQLNDYEIQVARFISMGRSDGYIAHHLGMSVQAVESCVLNAFEKTGTTTRTQLVHWLMDGPRGDWPK